MLSDHSSSAQNIALCTVIDEYVDRVDVFKFFTKQIHDRGREMDLDDIIELITSRDFFIIGTHLHQVKRLYLKLLLMIKMV